MHRTTRRLHWWRGLACGVVVLAVLTWALPLGTAQEDVGAQHQKTLAQRVAALEKLLKHFSREKNEIFITGANLHIINGLGRTSCTDAEGNPIPDCPNGLGNLIVGYNESRGELPPCKENPNPFCPDIRTGSHNVVVGQGLNFSRFGGLVVGTISTISGDFAVVSGGAGNEASGDNSSVSGGFANGASGRLSTVSGAQSNEARGDFAAVSGGQGGLASGFNAAISGGESNTASAGFAAVSGGLFNVASGSHSSVSGGRDNTASSSVIELGASSVSGGRGNTASGFFSSVSGGQNITQETDFGWSAGSEGDEVVVGNFRSP